MKDGGRRRRKAEQQAAPAGEAPAGREAPADREAHPGGGAEGQGRHSRAQGGAAAGQAQCREGEREDGQRHAKAGGEGGSLCGAQVVDRGQTPSPATSHKDDVEAENEEPQCKADLPLDAFFEDMVLKKKSNETVRNYLTTAFFAWGEGGRSSWRIW